MCRCAHVTLQQLAGIFTCVRTVNSVDFWNQNRSQRQKERLTIGVLPVLIPLLILGQPFVRLCAHRLSQVSECLGISEINLLKYQTKTNVELPGTLLSVDTATVTGVTLFVGRTETSACVPYTHSLHSEAGLAKWHRLINVWKLCISQGDTWDSSCRKEGNREMLLVLNKDTEEHCRPKAPIRKTGSF